MSASPAENPESFDSEFCAQRFAQQFCEQHAIPTASVTAAVRLLQDGNTLPFIARYRKDATGNLSETQLRAIEDGMHQHQILLDRKAAILKSLQKQAVLDGALQERIRNSVSLSALEELYLPYRPRRRTRAAQAREAGLEPLADILFQAGHDDGPRHNLIRPFINPDQGIADETAAVQGACDILAERWADDTAARQLVRSHLSRGRLKSAVRRGRKEEGAHFRDYFDFSQRAMSVPSHRFLAIRRGENEGFLRVSLESDDSSVLHRLRQLLLGSERRLFYHRLSDAVTDCFQRLLRPAQEKTILQELSERSDADAVEVFGRNLRSLLLAAPAGSKVTLGIDPGFRTGCKIAVVDGTGRFLESSTIFPTPPHNRTEESAKQLLRMIRTHSVRLISIGNGTGSRETHAFVRDILQQENLPITTAVVSEAGASVYSACELAVQEHPDLDVTIRGAISIAHRLQDPLAELVKIDPRSIGVGQYQHDVDQTLLRRTLIREVESCVNAVGVDLNTASASLLSFVSGVGPTLAGRIVHWREAQGPFASRDDLLSVPRFGPKVFRQAAGFLRIPNGNNPLDASAVHPEQYSVVEKIAAALQISVADITGNDAVLQQVQCSDFVGAEIGEIAIRDLLAELARPGRDPREQFREVQFDDRITEPEHLQPGMILEGVVTNVTQFGAFVDIGVHQDGLIHVSQLADHFVRNPADVISAGDIVEVQVLEVDLQRKRIGLSRKIDRSSDRTGST